MEPKVRFKKFDKPFVKLQLRDIANFSKGKGYSKSDLLSEGTPIILYGQLYTNYQFAFKNINQYASLSEDAVISKGNEIIIPASGETAEEIARASAVIKNGIILGGDLNILRLDVKHFDPIFAALAITYGKVHKNLIKYAQGKTVVHLHNSDIAQCDLWFPSDKQEQNRISLYFERLETSINHCFEKIESLKQIKAASLQSMFPQEGETIPKVRFKGFEGEWEKKEISQLCSKQSAHLTESTLGYNIGQYPVFGANGYIQNIAHYDIPSPYIGIIKDGSGIGRANIFPAFSSILGTLTYILPKDNIDLYFLLSIFRKIDLSKYKSGSSIPHIYFKDYGKVEVLIPSILEEQQKIGRYFKNLDNQISLQTQRLEKLKQIKAACLDKMFV